MRSLKGESRGRWDGDEEDAFDGDPTSCGVNIVAMEILIWDPTRSFVLHVAKSTASDDYGNKTEGRRKGDTGDKAKLDGQRRCNSEREGGKASLLLRGCKREASEDP